ncbi:ATP-binding protein [Leptotrichia sp.]|uniref:AAA family ATPase n=1 Tax=Leptotrichia sp. TaxID=104608 RepID=UPI00181001CB|nr:ATP-binding protein [Leptotrichia sp.]MBB1534684.1 ATP-binding protein [Leptotrichia sp.]
MKLTINNIGKLKNAEVIIDGITVITGENDTGKSTVGKVLWSVFNSFFEIKKQIRTDKISSILEELRRVSSIQDIRNNLVHSSIVEYDLDLNDFLKQLEKKLEVLNDVRGLDDESKDELKDTLEKIKKRINLSDDEIMKKITQINFNKEFNSQINNLNFLEEGNIDLKIKNKNINLIISNDRIQIKDFFSLYENVMLLDNPRIIDNLAENIILSANKIFSIIENSHNSKFISMLRNDKSSTATDNILNEEKLFKIEEKLNKIVDGKFLKKDFGVYFYRNKSGKEINVKNLSTGFKVFSIIKLLIQNNQLRENGTIILDEPEIHLHPEWQLKFAELIVLLQKEFGMHILLTTHSPYFLNAIEVFSERHKIDDKCKYYVAENEGNSSIIKDVTGNTREIYRKLARPIQDLENIRYSSDSDE